LGAPNENTNYTRLNLNKIQQNGSKKLFVTPYQSQIYQTAKVGVKYASHGTKSSINTKVPPN
jgi:hypothetical protein